MIFFGVLLCLFAVMSYVYPLIGRQLVFLLWLDRLPAAAQWGVRGALFALGIGLVVAGLRARDRGRRR